MKALFGKTEDTCSDGYIEHKGELFCYGVEFGSNAGGMDEFKIYDGCNRYVPIGIDDLDNLVEILQDLQASVALIKIVNPILEAVCDDKNVTEYP